LSQPQGVAQAIIMKGLKGTYSIEDDEPAEAQPKIVQEIMRLYNGDGMGADLMSAYRTPWGALQAVTQHFNHGIRGDVNSRFASVLQGTSHTVQTRAYHAATYVAQRVAGI
jgi:hypothetical protein